MNFPAYFLIGMLLEIIGIYLILDGVMSILVQLRQNILFHLFRIIRAAIGAVFLLVGKNG